jgi:CNT family concentrative nucleoside transporter
MALMDATEAGTSFTFGFLGGAPLPFEETKAGASFVFAFRSLPLIIVISALTALLTYWRILPWCVQALAKVLYKTFGIGGAAGLGTSANIFLNMVVSPLFVRPYLHDMARADLFLLMTAGMSTIAGTVLFLYASFLQGVMTDPITHLMTASVINIPAAILIARIMIPQQAASEYLEVQLSDDSQGSMDAITRGTLAGLQLYLNVIARLIVIVALVHLLNAGLGLLPDIGGNAITLERTLGLCMAPITWLMGIPWQEAATAGQLMGIKTILNEFLAYLRLAELPPGSLSERSTLIMTYALCGFANFGSLGILIGGLSTMVPERRTEIMELGPKCILSGTLATCCSGAVIGILF